MSLGKGLRTGNRRSRNRGHGGKGAFDFAKDKLAILPAEARDCTRRKRNCLETKPAYSAEKGTTL
jgi:hypothetical protein